MEEDKMLWEQDKMLWEQDKMLWEQNNILREQYDMLWEQNNKLWEQNKFFFSHGLNHGHKNFEYEILTRTQKSSQSDCCIYWIRCDF